LKKPPIPAEAPPASEEGVEMPRFQISVSETLPSDLYAGALAARVWRPQCEGPSVVAVRSDGLYDISGTFATISALCEADDPAGALKAATGERIGTLEEILANTPDDGRDVSKPWLLAPIDLQAIKAAGVTFATSMLERVIEERARGDLNAAVSLRAELVALIGEDLSKLKPGSPPAMRLKEALIAKGAWSQYLEVGIGPDAEIFTKSQPMSAIGHGADAGFHHASQWNNPEPEVVVFVNAKGVSVGASLGNDVNLRDVEGRSALLLGKAKDNNASCAIGPVLRFFDGTFSMDDVRNMDVRLTVEGPEGFKLEGGSSIAKISRDPDDIVGQMIGPSHQYPDGAVLFLGTMFAPIADRDAPGKGFTHHEGDIVTVAGDKLGRLTNRMRHARDCAPWTFGAGALMRNLARRGLL
jgi:fumarylacetoacetate (FAA) hydrolase family protein